MTHPHHRGVGSREHETRVSGVNASALALLAAVAFVSAWPVMAQQAIPDPDDNLIRNSRFERDLDSDSKPDEWMIEVGSAEAGMLLEGGPGSQRCVVLWDRGPGQTETALTQMLGSGLAAPEWYRITMLVRGADVAALRVQLDDAASGEAVGPPTRVQVTADWASRTAYVHTEKVVENGMLRLAFTGPGEVRLDNLVLQRLSPSESNIWPLEDTPNLLYNGSFEVGGAGWATMGYGGLVGALDNTTAIHGQRSFRTRWSPDVLPWVFFDFPKATLGPVEGLQLSSLGWMRFDAEKTYRYSLYAKSDRDDVPLRVNIVFLDQSAVTAGDDARVGTSWRRYRGVFKPRNDLGFLVVRPVLALAEGENASVWIDNVEITSDDLPTGYHGRCPVEIGLDTDRPGHVFPAGERITVRIEVYNYEDEPFTGALSVRATDYFDALVEEVSLPIEIGPDASARVSYELPSSDTGFFRIEASIKGLTSTPIQRIRVARLQGQGDDKGLQTSPLGLNHGYPFERQLVTLRDAGLRWVRTWALNWGEVEPEPGVWRFEDADAIIRELERLDLNILACLPFPSAPWANEVDEETMRKLGTPPSLGRMCFAPDDPELFAHYAGSVAAHYEGRIRHYELLNEPLVSSVCLPTSLSTPADYAELARLGAEGIRDVDPSAFIVGGLGLLPEPGRGPLSLYRETLAAGLAQAVDALNVHAYPRTNPPDHVAMLFSDFGALARTGAVEPLPVWTTEFGYYADDDPGPRAIPQTLFGAVASERECASYTVQLAAAMLSRGVERAFISAWPEPPNVATSTTDPFFEWDGQPRKPLAAVAAFSDALGPAPVPRGVEIVGGAVTAFLFERAEGAVAVIWPIRSNLTGQSLVLDVGAPGMGPSITIHDEIGNLQAAFPSKSAFRHPLPVDLGQTYVTMAGGNAEDLRQLLSRATIQTQE